MNNEAQHQLLALADQETALSQAPCIGDYQRINRALSRLVVTFYRRIAQGEEIEQVFTELVARARNVANNHNRRQQQLHGAHYADDWRTGLVDYYGADEAETRIRHARDMAAAIIARDK